MFCQMRRNSILNVEHLQLEKNPSEKDIISVMVHESAENLILKAWVSVPFTFSQFLRYFRQPARRREKVDFRE